MAARPEVLLAIGVDVEEEGLFRGHHPRRPAGVANVAYLQRLEFIPRHFGLPLTLLATYPVIQDPACREVLLTWRDQYAAELGAHPHVWNTPPFTPEEPWQTGQLARPALLAKLDHLLAEHERLLGRPSRCLRMGRFEMPAWLAEHLPGRGILVDSSLLPLHGQDSLDWPFLCPADPHPWGEGPAREQGLWEAPLTVAPLVADSQGLALRLAQALPHGLGQRLLTSFAHLGAVGVQPTMFREPIMRLAARLHLGRGGRVLNMFLHSSELMPGGSPDYASEAAVRQLLNRIAGFLEWLFSRYAVRGVTLGKLPQALAGQTAEGGRP